MLWRLNAKINQAGFEWAPFVAEKGHALISSHKASRLNNVCVVKQALGIHAKKHAGDVAATLVSSMKQDKHMWHKGNDNNFDATAFFKDCCRC
jgi:hypothetical protein